eukprot:TRINITY_DN113648_c0_g1_i1.p1 TRINITY_DN113648_c0_g1~~TRINITY_DN113648_c0_g1_i1.p1  ORF type:complete len:388 (+),score=-0.60 TRINITY_DN113648_c0_g1_i1:98-1261(+)
MSRWSPTSSNELLAFLGGTHLRLGRNSAIQIIKQSADVFRHIAGFVLRPDRRTLCASNGTLHLWDLETRVCVQSFPAHSECINGHVVNWQDKRALTGSDDGTLKLWDLHSGECIRSFQGHRSSVWAVAADWVNNLAASSSCDETVKIWNLNTGHCMQTCRADPDRMGSIFSIAVDWKHGLVLGSGMGALVKLWNVNTGACIRTFRMPDIAGVSNRAVRQLSVDWDSRRVLNMEWESLVLWDLESGDLIRRFGEEPGGYPVPYRQFEAFNVSWSLRQVLSASCDAWSHPPGAHRNGTLMRWDLESGQCIGVFATAPTEYVAALQVDWHSGDVLFSSLHGVMLWNMKRAEANVDIIMQPEQYQGRIIMQHENQFRALALQTSVETVTRC